MRSVVRSCPEPSQHRRFFKGCRGGKSPRIFHCVIRAIDPRSEVQGDPDARFTTEALRTAEFAECHLIGKPTPEGDPVFLFVIAASITALQRLHETARQRPASECGAEARNEPRTQTITMERRGPGLVWTPAPTSRTSVISVSIVASRGKPAPRSTLNFAFRDQCSRQNCSKRLRPSFRTSSVVQ